MHVEKIPTLGLDRAVFYALFNSNLKFLRLAVFGKNNKNKASKKY